MKKPLLAVVLAAGAFVALANVGVSLVGSLRQVGVMTSVTSPANPTPSGDIARRASLLPSGSADTAIRAEPVRATDAPAARAQEPEAREPEPSFEPADSPGPAFDPEDALHAAAAADPNVAELLNNADPAVGAAVRDLVYTLAAP